MIRNRYSTRKGNDVKIGSSPGSGNFPAHESPCGGIVVVVVFMRVRVSLGVGVSVSVSMGVSMGVHECGYGCECVGV